ncbi:MAG: hypothetical protein AAF722_09700 [Cyanobacteria bacterium P01_C01_bin.70]
MNSPSEPGKNELNVPPFSAPFSTATGALEPVVSCCTWSYLDGAELQAVIVNNKQTKNKEKSGFIQRKIVIGIPWLNEQQQDFLTTQFEAIARSHFRRFRREEKDELTEIYRAILPSAFHTCKFINTFGASLLPASRKIAPRI